MGHQVDGGGKVIAGPPPHAGQDGRHSGEIVPKRLPEVAHRVAGQQQVGRRGVVHIVVGHGAYEANLVQPAGDSGQVLANAHTGQRGLDGGELPAVFDRGVGLGIEGVLLGRTSPKEDEDASLGRFSG